MNNSFRKKIETMVENAITQCRRDLLWQRMLITTNMAEEEGRRKRRSERVDPDQEKDTVSITSHTTHRSHDALCDVCFLKNAQKYGSETYSKLFSLLFFRKITLYVLHRVNDPSDFTFCLYICSYFYHSLYILDSS